MQTLHQPLNLGNAIARVDSKQTCCAVLCCAVLCGDVLCSAVLLKEVRGNCGKLRFAIRPNDQISALVGPC